jgi:phosphate uptake regulator
LTVTSKRHKEETRKLQITGGSTYIISLPKKWVTQNNVKKGSPLLIREEEDGSLSILPQELEKPEKSEEALIKVSPKDNPDTITRKTVSAYLVGYSIIRIAAEKQQPLSSRQRNTIKTFARNLLVGTEIITDTSTELKLQVLLSYPELSVLNALRRMGIITCSMHKESIGALKKLDRQLAKDIIATDNEVDRFHLYIIRQLKMAMQNPRIIKEIGLNTPRDCLGYRLVTKTVERTADHAANIAKNVLLFKNKIEDNVLTKIEQMSELATSSFETALESLFKRDYALAESVIGKSEEIASMEKEVVLTFKESEIEEISSLRLLVESVRRTAEYASDIAEIVLNLTVGSILG